MASKKVKPERRVIEGWDGVSSFALGPGGRIVAGENGGYRLCCWDAGGAVVWHHRLASSGSNSRYSFETMVAVTDTTVLALMHNDGKLFSFDAVTGAPRGEHAIEAARTFALTPDARTLVLRTGTKTTLCDYPSLAVVARWSEYCNQNEIAISPDGKWLAVAGHQIHVYDLLQRKHVKTWEPDESPWAMVFSADSQRLLTGDRKNMLRAYDAGLGWERVKEVGRGRAPTITAIAASADGRWIAAATDTGTIALHSGATLEIERELKGHDPSQPDTGARSISQVGFAPDGTLVIAAPPKKEPAGLALYLMS